MNKYIDIPKKLSSSKVRDIDLLTGKELVMECISNIIYLEDGETKMSFIGVNIKQYLLKINDYHTMLTLTKKMKTEIEKIDIVKTVNIQTDVNNKTIKISVTYKTLIDNSGNEVINFNLREMI